MYLSVLNNNFDFKNGKHNNNSVTCADFNTLFETFSANVIETVTGRQPNCSKQ